MAAEKDCRALILLEEGIERWVDAEAVAKHLGVSKASIYKWRINEGLPGNKIGKLYRFLLSDVDNWIYNQINEGAREK
jgi:excisionase family DNA binding protein